jgi:hypothetical protein
MLVRALMSMAVVTGAALAFPAAINDGQEMGGAPVQEFRHGMLVDVFCPNVELVQSDGVSVVMYPSREDTTSGVAGVLVTERTIDPGVVHVRVPDIPDLKDHVVRVKIYYRDAVGKHACDAGRIRLI